MHYDIVVVGGGAGGLELASKLGRAMGRKVGPEKVLLIDRSVFHIWKPTLHEVAAGTLNPQQEGLSYSILARSNHFSFMVGELIKFDPQAKKLTLKEVHNQHGGELIIPERHVTFDRCILAIGSGSNFFNTPGSEHAYVLENAQDAQEFHAHLLNLFARAAYSEDKRLSVVIVGAGATGVELSAEMMEAYHEIQDNSGSGQRFRIEITLVEAAPRVLSGLPEKVSAQAIQALRQKHIKVMTGTRVLGLHSDRVETDQGDLAADVIVWAAGIKAADRNQEYGLPVNRINQFEVNRQLQTPADGVYAMGDCAACEWEDGKFVPARAQAAHQQADFLCDLLMAYEKGRDFNKEFVYKDSGSLVSLGTNHGVGNLMGSLSGGSFFIEGLIAKYMYMSLHLMHHKAIIGIRKTILLALSRFAQKRVSGRLKLH
ncbi:NAD(P)/FAD-dependent oxidoreductase [Neisseria perflava]|uniref:NAD(P)/FAD-dependent oxidoreductase n=1 Tax=Neisseria perflava TaxID=33053 RepID=UPI0020A036FE|nr:FAD-dependent oxidoreductase [Neisseria perflava]MCP1660622.1 NADH dehydrogenase [Neisseria perflava]MCP1772378.1 NADH dehydrogenase [Neisseria perflava]